MNCVPGVHQAVWRRSRLVNGGSSPYPRTTSIATCRVWLAMIDELASVLLSKGSLYELGFPPETLIACKPSDFCWDGL